MSNNKKHNKNHKQKGRQQPARKGKAAKKTTRATRTKIRGAIHGRGTYFGDVGQRLGARAGAYLGSKAGNMLGSILGSGSYKLSRNSLSIPTENGPPTFLATKDGSMIVAHREYIADITSSTVFTNRTFNINPGLAATFPWLSQIASNFEQYEMLGLIFEFKTTSASSVASTNTALGVAIMATEYNVDATPFSNKQQMESYQFSCSSTPSASFIHPVECAAGENVLKNMYVRTGSVPTGEDPRFYDLGLFQLATAGMQAPSTIGELWVSYHVKLRKPKLRTLSGNAQSAHLTTHYDVSTSTLAPFTVVSGTTLGVNITIPVSNQYTIVFPTQGNYLVNMTNVPASGGGTLSGQFYNSYGSGAGGLPFFGPTKTNTILSTTTTIATMSFACTTLAGGTATITVPGAVTTDSYFDVVVTVLAESQLSLSSKTYVSRMRTVLRDLLLEMKQQAEETDFESDTDVEESKNLAPRQTFGATLGDGAVKPVEPAPSCAAAAQPYSGQSASSNGRSTTASTSTSRSGWFGS
jgi:hypothetical protein